MSACVTDTSTTANQKAASRSGRGEIVRLLLLGPSTVLFLGRRFLAALEWFWPANPDGSRLEERPTNGVFGDFMCQVEVLRLSGRPLGLLGHDVMMPE